MNRYYRFFFGLRKFLGERDSLVFSARVSSATETIRQRLAAREETFLAILRQAVYGHPQSPYLDLLRRAGVEEGDVAAGVRKSGLEETLRVLRRAGVYTTIDEYKGKVDTVRGSARFHYTERSFDNPFLSGAFSVRSGGTRGTGARVMIDFDYLVAMTAYNTILLDAFQGLSLPIASWFPVFPGAPGVNSCLRFARMGNIPERWFSQVENSVRVDWRKRWGLAYIIRMSRLMGVPIPPPEFVDLNHGEVVARWAHEAAERAGGCWVYTFVGSAVRACAAATDLGLRLSGTRFLVTGEPLTARKKAEIEATGARALPVYGVSEAGTISGACGEPAHSDDCHMFRDAFAVIQHRRQLPLWGREVDAFLFTSLLPQTPKILLNSETGDYGVVEERDCGCPLGRLGFTKHIHHIRSFEKMTGEGVSFVDTDLVRILEERLPGAFGGRSTDYQLVETEDEAGLTRLRLYVSPKLGPLDEDQIVSAFIAELKREGDSPQAWLDAGSEMWRQAGAVKVVREFPLTTRGGKIYPFFLKDGRQTSRYSDGISGMQAAPLQTELYHTAHGARG
ncbi:MAG: hypothetical protein V2A77_06385 [Pseudomonadota bacterium]